MRITIAAATAALGLVVAARALPAQGPPRLGGQMSFAHGLNAGLGLRVEQALTSSAARPLRLQVTFDYFFPDQPFHYWEVNTGLIWGFSWRGSPLSLYAGGGIGLGRSQLSGVSGSGHTDVGVNLLLGMRLATATRLTPFVELRPELGGGNYLVLSAGLIF
jgi:hypothetical protein